MKKESKKKTICMDLLLLTLAIGAIYCVFLGHYALVAPDEGRYCEIAREMIANGNFLVPTLNHILYFEKPPFFYWLQALSILVLGFSEWSMRFWTAFFALLGCLTIYLTGQRFFSRRTGLYAAFILATSLLYFAMGHLITLDMTISVLITISLMLFLFGIKTPAGLKRRLLISGAFAIAALAVLTKGLIGFFLPIMIVGLWVLILNKWRELLKWYLPSSVIIFLIIALPWHILLQHKYPFFLHFYFVEQHFSRYFTAYASRTEPLYFYLCVFLIGFFPWSVFFVQALKKAWPAWRKRHQHEIEIFLMIWIFSILIFFSCSRSQLIPYILPILPPAALLVGNYFATTIRQHIKGLIIGFILLLVFGFGFDIAFSVFLKYYPAAHPFLAEKFLLVLAIFLSTTVLIAFIFFWTISARSAIITIMLGISLSYFTGLLALPYIDHRSTKPLAKIILRNIKPNDKMVTYNHYYQDLTFYLRHHTIVVNCLNELDFGVKHMKSTPWMINRKTFWHDWTESKRLFVVTRNDDFNVLKKHRPNIRFYVLGQTQRNILFSNKGN